MRELDPINNSIKWMGVPPRTLALLFFLLVCCVSAFFYSMSPPQSLPQELRVFESRQPAKNQEVTKKPILPEADNIKGHASTSKLVAENIFNAAYLLENDSRGDLFDCYVSLFLPPDISENSLYSIREAIRLIDAIPAKDRDYRYYIKRASFQFYRFAIIPVLHQRKEGETDLSPVELAEEGESFDSALYDFGRAGPSVAMLEAHLRKIASSIHGPSGKYENGRLIRYLRGKRNLVRQIS